MVNHWNDLDGDGMCLIVNPAGMMCLIVNVWRPAVLSV
jgi:hypothetical protein